MSMLKKAKSFLLLDTKTKLLLIEAFLLLGWARLLKWLPFSRIVPMLGEQMSETPAHIQESYRKPLRQVSHAIQLMSRYTFWESMCLVQAIAAMKMLERRRIESTLYLGTAKDEKGNLIAHAWLRSGSFFITGGEVREQFTVVRTFAKRTP